MKTRHGAPSFILANKLAVDYRTREGIAGELVTICPRRMSGFSPHCPCKPADVDPEEALFTRVHYANGHIDLFVPYRRFITTLTDAGVVLVDARSKPEAAGPVGP